MDGITTPLFPSRISHLCPSVGAPILYDTTTLCCRLSPLIPWLLLVAWFLIVFLLYKNGAIPWPRLSIHRREKKNTAYAVRMKFLDWYVKIAVGSALIGASMEFFMIKTGFYDKVTVLESEKRAWESSPEAQAIRDALNPWKHHDAEARKNS